MIKFRFILIFLILHVSFIKQETFSMINLDSSTCRLCNNNDKNKDNKDNNELISLTTFKELNSKNSIFNQCYIAYPCNCNIYYHQNCLEQKLKTPFYNSDGSSRMDIQCSSCNKTIIYATKCLLCNQKSNSNCITFTDFLSKIQGIWCPEGYSLHNCPNNSNNLFHHNCIFNHLFKYNNSVNPKTNCPVCNNLFITKVMQQDNFVEEIQYLPTKNISKINSIKTASINLKKLLFLGGGNKAFTMEDLIQSMYYLIKNKTLPIDNLCNYVLNEQENAYFRVDLFETNSFEKCLNILEQNMFNESNKDFNINKDNVVNIYKTSLQTDNNNIISFFFILFCLFKCENLPSIIVNNYIVNNYNKNKELIHFCGGCKNYLKRKDTDNVYSSFAAAGYLLACSLKPKPVDKQQSPENIPKKTSDQYDINDVFNQIERFKPADPLYIIYTILDLINMISIFNFDSLEKLKKFICNEILTHIQIRTEDLNKLIDNCILKKNIFGIITLIHIFGHINIINAIKVKINDKEIYNMIYSEECYKNIMLSLS